MPYNGLAMKTQRKRAINPNECEIGACLPPIDRLALALTEYRETNPQPRESAKVYEHLSLKYRIGVKTIRTGVLMEAGGINSEKGLK